MSNVLEFYLRMKDMMSSGLARVARTGTTSFGAVEGAVNRVHSAMDRAGAGVDRYASQLRNARSETERLTRSSGGLGVGGLIKGNLLTGAVQQIIGGAGQFVASSMSKAMEFGKTQTTFDVLTGSKDKGQALTGGLNKLQQDTILGPEVFKNAQTMLGFGVAAEKVLPSMRMLGDISMGDAERLQSLTLAFSQVSSAGKLTGQDLLQFVNAGFNPLNEISRTTGISMATLKEQMAAGAITAKMIEGSFVSATGAGGRYNEMMAKIAATPAGKMAIFEGKLESFKIKFGTAMLPLQEMALTWGGKLLEVADKVIPSIVFGVNQVLNFVSSISSGTSEWSDLLGILGSSMSVMWDGLKYIWQVVSYIVSDFLKWYKSSELVKDIFSSLSKFGEVLWGMIKQIGYTLQEIWTNVIRPVLDGIEKAYRWVKGLLGYGKSEIQVTNKTVSEFKSTTPTQAAGSAVAGAGGSGKGEMSGVSGNSTAGRITSSGPRNIYISIGKMVEKIEIHSANMKDGIDNLEGQVCDVFLRILNGGASVQ